LIETLSEFDIADDISGSLDKAVQRVLLLEVGNQPLVDRLVKAMEVLASNPGIWFVGFIFKLEDKHLEFSGVFVWPSLGSCGEWFPHV
jgi:hypothetical protein